MKIKISGTGSYLPEKILTNEDFSAFVETSDEWITSRTGIKERHISTGEATWEMGLIAAKNALENAGIDPLEIDLIIATTITPDYFLPSMSCIIQGKIGAKNAFAFDMNAACSGFVYALDNAACYIAAGKAKKALIISSETISKLLDYSDRSTCVLFGDGAAAVVVEASENDDMPSSCLKSEGEGAKYLVSRALKNDTPFGTDTSDIVENLNKHYFYMDGKEVFKFATRAMPAAIEDCLTQANLKATDIDFFVPHQANKRIIDFVSSKYGYDKEKTIIGLDRFGNTSSASIPILLDELNREGKLKKGDLLMLTGFGAGLTYGAAIIRWTK